MAETLVIGIGNPFRRDDGVGPWVAETLARQGANARIHAGDGAGLIDLFQSFHGLILVDATYSGAEIGQIREFDALAAPLPADFFHYSTHRFGLAEAVETARALDLLPTALRVIGIEGADFGPGEGLSPAVAAAAQEIAARLAQDLAPD